MCHRVSASVKARSRQVFSARPARPCGRTLELKRYWQLCDLITIFAPEIGRRPCGTPGVKLGLGHGVILADFLCNASIVAKVNRRRGRRTRGFDGA
jgi:hypothetical protein